MTVVLASAPTRIEPRWEYQRQDTPMTLSQGLEEYYRANAGRIFRPEHLSNESRDLFRNHDLCHVIFGLDTTLGDEIMADTRTLLSCDVGLRRYARDWLTAPEAKAIYKEIGIWRPLAALLLALPRILRGINENRRMRWKWPWHPPSDYLDRSIAALRREYGIRVI